MHLTDLMTVEEWMEFEREMNRRSGLDMNIFDPDGIRITPYKNWVNRLCPEVKANDKGQSFICAVAHLNIAAQAKQERGPVIEECDAGIVKMIVPIFMDGEFLGAAGGCGRLLEKGEVDTFLINKITGIDEKTIQDLAADIPVITMEDTRSLAEHIEKSLRRVIDRYREKKP
ncbi:MAG: histidine kinase [Desulfobacteraceae bacterium]|nr:MAG: histidine kinase [Desulfobacteraceae bacterium]